MMRGVTFFFKCPGAFPKSASPDFYLFVNHKDQKQRYGFRRHLHGLYNLLLHGGGNQIYQKCQAVRTTHTFLLEVKDIEKKNTNCKKQQCSLFVCFSFLLLDVTTTKRNHSSAFYFSQKKNFHRRA